MDGHPVVPTGRLSDDSLPTLMSAYTVALAARGGHVPDNNMRHIRIAYTDINRNVPSYNRAIAVLRASGLSVAESGRGVRIWRNNRRFSSATAKRAHRAAHCQPPPSSNKLSLVASIVLQVAVSLIGLSV